MTHSRQLGSEAADASSVASTPELHFEQILRERGLHEAMRFLNKRTRHRFTGLYRIEARMLYNICMFDRENPLVRIGTDAPLEETYCSFLAERRSPLHFEDSAREEIVAMHPARTRIISYCGVPIMGADGTAQGSLCHFDLRPRLAPVAEIPLMERASLLLLPFIRPASPGS